MTSVAALKVSGIYKITCKATGNFYVGSSVDIQTRWASHRRELRKGTHHAPYMQRSWDKHGEDSFCIDVLEQCGTDSLKDREQYFLDALSPQFNVCKTAYSPRGIKKSDKTKKLVSNLMRARNRKWMWQGKKMCLVEIAEKEGVEHNMLRSRVDAGWDIARAVEQSPRIAAYEIEHKGNQYTVNEFAAFLDCHPRRVSNKLKQGMSPTEIACEINYREKHISIESLCMTLGLSPTTAKSRMQKGELLIDALARPADEKYRNKRAAA